MKQKESGVLDSQSEGKEQETVNEVSFLGLFRFAGRTQMILMFIGGLCAMIVGATIPASTYLIGDIINAFISSDSQDSVFDRAKSAMLYNLAIGAGALVIGSIMNATWLITGERLGIKCRREYFKSLLRQEVGWFDTQNQAAMSSRFEQDAMAYQLAVGEKVSGLMVIVGMVVSGLALSFYRGWILTLILAVYMPFMVICYTKNTNIKAQLAKQEDQVYNQSDAKIQQSLSAITVVKQLNAEAFECSIQEGMLQKIKDLLWTSIAKYLCGTSLSTGSLFFCITLAFWYSSQCVFGTAKCPAHLNREAYTAGMVCNINYSLIIACISLNQLGPSIDKIKVGRQAASRLFAVIERTPKIKSKPNAIIPQEFYGVIQFKDVSFAYPKEPQKLILDKLSIKLDYQHSAIIGESGCGKSTIFQLIMRFYDPTEGAILLDGNNLKDIDLTWLRTQIGYVTQQPVLFATTIRQNILFGKPDASEGQILEALKKAEAFEFVNDLSEQLDTYVGSSGSQLSGGQKQRLAIARAVLKKPKLLLMDEATSALDKRNQTLILATLNEVGRQITTISITHRKRVLGKVDKVYGFKNGRISTSYENKDVLKRRSSNISSMLSIDEDRTSVPALSMKKISSKEHKMNKLDSAVQLLDETEMQLQNVEETQEEHSIFRVTTYLRNKKVLLVLGIVIPLLDGFVYPTIGYLIARIFATQLNYSQDPEYYKSQAWIYSYSMLGVSIFGIITNGVSIMLHAIIAEHALKRLRLEAIQKLLRMPLSWFETEENHPLKVSNRLTSNCKVLYQFMRNFTPHVLIVIVNIFGSMLASLFIEWRSGLTSFALMPILAIAMGIQHSFMNGLTQSKGKIYNQSSLAINQAVMNVRTVYALGNIEHIHHRYKDNLSHIFEILSKKSILIGFMHGLSYLLHSATFALIFFMAVVYIYNFGASKERSLQAVCLTILASISAGNAFNLITDMTSAKLAAKNLFSTIDLEDQQTRLVKWGSKQLKEPIKGNITFRNVSFKYESRNEMALDNFNLNIKEGQTLAVIGASGCGKSTVLSMLLGFYQPTQGNIYLEGIDIRDYDLHHLRASFGVVSQEPVLFNQTVEWNIRYNASQVTQEQLIQVAKHAQLSFAKNETNPEPNSPLSLTQNLCSSQLGLLAFFDTKVGPRGCHVSGGQKQRIAIARTLLRNPKVLLLDEATSALDPENQAKVEQALKYLMKGKTTLNVTHRTQNIAQQCLVAIINHGSLKAIGSCKELHDDPIFGQAM